MTYKELVVLEITFRESPVKESKLLVAFVVIPDATLPMILGCPTLDKLEAWWTREEINLGALNVTLPTVLPPECRSDEAKGLIVRARNNLVIEPDTVVDLKLPISAAQSALHASWKGEGYMRSGPQVPLGLVVFEGPMRVEQHAGVDMVVVSVCAEADTPVRLGPGSQTFRIGHARQEDY